MGMNKDTQQQEIDQQNNPNKLEAYISGNRRTIAEVKKELFKTENIRKGQICPCCNRFMKMYKWPFLKSMVTALTYFNKHQIQKGNEFFHFENYLRENNATKCRGGFNYLKYWGLIEKRTADKKNKKPIRGYYRITNKGIQFLKGKIKIPKHLLLYDDKVEGFSIEEVKVENIYKNFDYEQMIKQ